MTQSEPAGFADHAEWLAAERKHNARIHNLVKVGLMNGLARADAITRVMRDEEITRGDVASAWHRHERGTYG